MKTTSSSSSALLLLILVTLSSNSNLLIKADEDHDDVSSSSDRTSSRFGRNRRHIRSRTFREETSIAIEVFDSSKNILKSSSSLFDESSSSLQQQQANAAQLQAAAALLLMSSASFHHERSPVISSKVQEEDDDDEDSSSSTNHRHHQSMIKTTRNITAQVGHSVFLHCFVESSSSDQKVMVSWIRLRDFHLLTVGDFTYTSDERFVVRSTTSGSGSNPFSDQDWSLSIKHVSLNDEGIYECQVNSEPPRSTFYSLRVLVPQTTMIGSQSSDMFVRAGHALQLTCRLTDSPEVPSLVFWYRNDRMINYDLIQENYGSITLTKEIGRENSFISRLFVKKASLNDSGNYSCHFVGSTSTPASIYVHVLQGKSCTHFFHFMTTDSCFFHTKNRRKKAVKQSGHHKHSKWSTSSKNIIFFFSSK